MNSGMEGDTPVPAGVRRRRLLIDAGAVAAALTLPFGASAAQPDTELRRFLEVSRRLTGQEALEPSAGVRILDLLRRGGQTRTEILDRLTRVVLTSPPADLAGRLAEAKLEPIAQEVLLGWYAGIVGPEDSPAFVTYPEALMWRAVMDVHNVPSFCGGLPGFWAEDPGGYANPFVQES